MTNHQIINTVIAFFIGGFSSLICYGLFRLWKPLIPILAGMLIIYVGPYNVFFYTLLSMAFLFAPLMCGTFFLGASATGEAPAKYVWAFASVYPFLFFTMVIGAANPYLAEENQYTLFYYPFLLFSFVLTNFLMWRWQMWWDRRGGFAVTSN